MKLFTIHTLVLTAFVGPRPEDKECCHRDGNPTNCNLSNLRWGTRGENAQDRNIHGRQVRKLTDDDVRCIVNDRTGGMKQEDLAAKYGVRRAAIKDVLLGKTWKHIPRNRVVSAKGKVLVVECAGLAECGGDPFAG